MKKIFSLMAAALMAFSFTSCLDTSEEPDVTEFSITATDIPAANTTIAAMKDKYSSQMSTNNAFVQVNEDVIFEGVVVGNDISGNLYQTLILRSIESTPGAADDQCIQLGIKNTFISPYFPLGQRLRVNLNGLYVGNYSKTPKVGQPYYTSAGNLRLGPMLLQLCATNIQKVGTPDPSAPELTPMDFTTAEGQAWLKASANRTYKNSPMLAKAYGYMDEMSEAKRESRKKGELSGEWEPLPKIFAPKALYDAGYAVDRTLVLDNSTKVTIRTSTQNTISYLAMPTDKRTYTGIFTYYDGWQIQLRDVDDIAPMLK